MYTDNTLRVINDNDAFTHTNGVKYPSNYPKSEIAGLYPVTETDVPTTDDIVIEGFHIELVEGVYTQIWCTRKKTNEEKASELKGRAYTALTESDMVALRCFKSRIDFPDIWKEYVVKLRQVVNGELEEIPVTPDYPEGS